MRADRREPPLVPEDPVEVLVEAGFVDLDFVAAQLGRSFATATDAARAVIESGDASPHPLVEFGWLPRRKSWQRSGLHPISWYAAERRRRNRLPTHPLVDPRLIWTSHLDARFHPFGVLSYWLDMATPDTPLPTQLLSTPVTWGEFRAAAVEAAAAWREDSAIRRPRRTPPVDSGTADGVSVVMIARDAAPLLRSTVATLQAQTFTDWELIAVDAGSLDDTAAVLDGLAAFDERITVLREPRQTPGASLNTAVEQARHDHLAFLAPGRSWPVEHLSQVLAHAAGTGHAFVQVGTGPVARTREELLAGRPADLSTALVRRDAIKAVGGFDESLAGAVERDLALRLTQQHAMDPVDLPVERRPDSVLNGSGNAQVEDWESFVLEQHLVDWESVSARSREADLVSYVLPLGSELRRTVEWLTAVSLNDAERIVVGTRLPRHHHMLAGSLAAIVPGARFVRVQADVNVNVAINIGASQAGGSTVALVRPEAMPPRQSITARLAGALAEPGVAVVQPVVAAPDGTVLSGGARFAPGHDNPGLFLAGHVVEDARRIGQCRVGAPASPLIALRASTFEALHGLDCRFRSVLAETDLGLRALAAGHGESVLLPDAVVSSRGDYATPEELVAALASLRARDLPHPSDDTPGLLRRAGFEVTDHRTQRISASPRRSALLPLPVVRAIDGIHESPPRLRWAIDIASPAAARGDRWGDTHFARSLASALEQRGQDVAVDRRDARDRDTRDHDDVLLVLRGLDRVEPRPGLLNMEWIISHPDMVTPEEVVGFDTVYAASLSWTARAAREWGVPITPLLQCTDPRWFHPDRAEPDTGPEVVFVGNSRGVYRFAVRSALAIGAPLTLHGNDWKEFVPAEVIASNGLANEDVGALYASAGVVLNDHHLDMRRDSFASNRLFDAAACGARIVSDPIEGLDETFSGLVQTFRNEAELRELISRPYPAFPDDATRRSIAQRIVAEHTFDRRAETLIGDAVRLLRERGR